MQLTKNDMKIIVEALHIAYSKYDIDVKVAMHNYEDNATSLIRRKAEIEALYYKLTRKEVYHES